MNTVKITADKDGKFAYPGEKGITAIRVAQSHFNEKGFETMRYGFLKVKDANVGNYSLGQIIPGTIRRTETLVPQYEGHQPKKAGTDGNVITSGGRPVYMQDEFTGNVNASDILLPSDKVAAPVERTAE